MRRIGSVVCLLLIFVMVSAACSMASTGGLKRIKEYPQNGATGLAVGPASVKIWFNEDVRPRSEAVRKSNEKAISIVDEHGKPIVDRNGKAVPVTIAYNPDVKGLMMVMSDPNSTLAGNTTYTLTIGPSFQATSGDKLGTPDKVTFTTLNQSRSTMIYMLLMGLMLVGMIFFSMRTVKKEKAKDSGGKKTQEPVNPYKEAKKTGKSVGEIVEREKKNKEKQEAAKEKAAGKEKAGKSHPSDGKRVSGPRPISAAGGAYRPPRKKKTAKPAPQPGTTRPKNQTGKQKNAKRKK